MKKRIRSIIIILTICLLCPCFLLSCSGGIDTDEAKEHINEFLSAMAQEDYEKAEKLLHPDRPADIEEFIKGYEEQTGLDLSSGITVKRNTGFNYTYYSSNVGGSSYELTMSAEVGGTNITITVEIVQNDNGYGVYNFYIN